MNGPITLEEITQLINSSTHKFNIEIVSMKSEIEVMKSKIQALEKSNVLLVKEKNLMIVKEFSQILITLIENNEFEKFKELIEKHDYPINEYFYLKSKSNYERPFLNNLNLLHFSIESNKKEFAIFLIERGADVNLPDKNVNNY